MDKPIPATPFAPWQRLAAETGLLARMSVPILLAQFAQVGMNFVDTVMAGHYSAEALAGVAVASSVWWPVIMLAVGVLLALPAMSAQLVGARRRERAAHLLRQGVWLAALLSAAAGLALFLLAHRIAAFGAGADLEPVAREYLLWLIPGVPPFLLFICLRSFLEGYGRMRPAMVIGALSLVLNIPANYVFIYGSFGLPEMGGAGCGLATSLCFWFRCAALLLFLHRDKDLGRWSLLRAGGWLRGRKGGAGKSGRGETGQGETGMDEAAERELAEAAGWPLVDPPVMGQIARVGLPNALALTLETALFSLTAILLAPLGATAVAAHSATMSWENLSFTVPLAVNMTAAIRVGHCLGAGRFEAARRAAWAALLMGALICLGCLVSTIVFADRIAALYTSDPAVAALAVQTLFLCALLQPGDTTQGIASGILRGYNDTAFVSRICLFVCTIPGLGLGWLLARTDLVVPAMGARGFWTAYIAAMSLCGLCYVWRVTRLHRLPPERIRERLAR